MPSNSHQAILVKAINEYFEKGYKLISLNSNLTDNYRPDAVVENHEEIVIIEVVLTSDRTQRVEVLQTLFPKTLRIDKRIMKPKRTKISKGSQVAKMTLETIREHQGITPSEISMKTGITIQYVRNTLATLVELKLVETPVRGIYIITDLGKYVLNCLQKEHG